jgi:NAD(P)-dependent dehydrogenase (short-subunit alcohol dehydrogenase family)
VKTEVIVVIGAGGIGMAIARRQGFGRHILLADFNEKLLEAAAKELEVASYKVSSRKVDVSSRDSVRALADLAASLGSVMQVINTAGISPNMAPPGCLCRQARESSSCSSSQHQLEQAWRSRQLHQPRRYRDTSRSA